MSPLKKAKGLGAAHHGTGHWISQRVSAVALILLGAWFISSLFEGLDQGSLLGFLNSPWNASLMILFLGFGFYHAALGLQVIVEDYVHTHLVKYGLLLLVKFACLAGAVTSIISTFIIMFKG